MKILLIVHSVIWKGGGAYFHAFHLAKSLSHKGHQVTLLCTSEKGFLKFKYEEIENVKIVQAPDIYKGSARNGWDIYNTIRRVIWARNQNFDIVHCLDCRPVVIFPGLFFKYIKKSTLIIEWLDWFGKGGTATERKSFIKFFMCPIESFFEERFRKYADGTIGLGEPLADRAKSAGVNNNIITIYHGSDTEHINIYPKEEARKILQLDQNKIYIGYTGRLREDAVEIFSGTIIHLRESHKMDVTGIFIGNTNFNAKSFIEKKYHVHFIFTDWIKYKEINLYLSSCDILLLPFKKTIARDNIWPSKINDYLSAGKPIVATRLKVITKLMDKYEACILCDDNYESFSEKCSLILSDYQSFSYLGKNARDLSEKELSWKNIGNQVEKFYKEVKKGQE